MTHKAKNVFIICFFIYLFQCNLFNHQILQISSPHDQKNMINTGYRAKDCHTYMLIQIINQATDPKRFFFY